MKKYLLGASEAIRCLLELLFLVDAASSNFGVASTELGVALLTWNETSIFWNGVVSEWNWGL